MPSITRRSFVAAPSSSVWRLVTNLSQWHPKISSDDVVEIVKQDDVDTTLVYSAPHPPAGITGHQATIVVTDNGFDTSYVEWTVDFSAEPSRIDELEDRIGDEILNEGIDRLATRAQDEAGANFVNDGTL